MLDQKTIFIQMGTPKVSFEQYLSTILNKGEVEDLIGALDCLRESDGEIKSIYIGGDSGATGKSTLKEILESMGYPVIEAYETYPVILEDALKESYFSIHIIDPNT